MERDVRASRDEKLQPEGVRPLGSRLRPPRAHLKLVVRGALVERLRRTSAPLVLVNAPAGYGKTTLLTQWVERDGRPFAWLQLAAIHNDPVAFLTYLASALANVAKVDSGLIDLLNTGDPPIEELILPALGSAVETAAPFLLVLDDAHLVGNAACWRHAVALLDQFPDGARLALASRGDPALPLPRLRACGGVTEVRADDLRMTAAEARSVLGMHGCEAGDEELDDLLRVTEGWPTGIYLALLAGDGCPTRDLLTRLHGDQREIAGYLTTEVIDLQPAEVQEFLLRTSILDQLTPGLCHAVTGRDDAVELLDDLVRESLFVTPLDHRDEWYRYHHLFAELLLAQLEHRGPDTIPNLHRRAAAWYETHQDGERAVLHAVAAGDADAVVDLAARTCDELLCAGQAERAARLLSSFSDKEISRNAALRLTALELALVSRSERLERLARSAESLLVDDSPAPVGAISLRAWQAWARGSRARGGVTAMRDDAALAVALTEDDEDWGNQARFLLAIACYLLGNTQRAASLLSELERRGPGDDEEHDAWLGWQILMASDRGDWEAAERLDGRLRLEPDGRMLAPVLARALVLSRRGEPRLDAFLATAKGGPSMPHGSDGWRTVLAADVFGEIALQRGDDAEADRWTAQAETTLAHYPDAGVLCGRTKRLREALEERRLAEPLTAAERRVLDLLPTQLTAKQIAARLFLTENTVKSHMSHIYRKLGATTRTGAVDRALALGLL